MRDEVLDLLSSCIAKSFHPAEIGRIRLDQSGVELMLTNDLAQAIANLGAAIVPVSICRLRRKLLRFSGGLRWFSARPDFLNRADADAVGFAEGTVDGARFCHAHFRTVNQRGNIGRIRVAVTDESFAVARFEDGRLEGPTRSSRFTELNGRAHLNPHATLSASYSQEAGMGDIPPISKIRDIAVHHGNVVQSN